MSTVLLSQCDPVIHHCVQAAVILTHSAIPSCHTFFSKNLLSETHFYFSTFTSPGPSFEDRKMFIIYCVLNFSISMYCIRMFLSSVESGSLFNKWTPGTGRKKIKFINFLTLEDVIVYEIYLKILKSPTFRQFNYTSPQSLCLTFFCYFSCYLQF